MKSDPSLKEREKLQLLDETFGRVLRQKRTAQNLRMVDLETIEGIKRSNISSIETGKSQICLRGLFQVAEALDITPEDLIREVREAYEREIADQGLR